jgi:hypothetical protein
MSEPSGAATAQDRPHLASDPDAYYRSLWILQHLLEAQDLGVDSKARLKELVEEHTADPDQALLEHLRTVIQPDTSRVSQS